MAAAGKRSCQKAGAAFRQMWERFGRFCINLQVASRQGASETAAVDRGERHG
jgi:hypothetical protein